MQAMKVAGFVPNLFWSQFFVGIPYPKADFSGQTVIVTGSNTGLGKEAARHLVRLGASKVVLAVRTISKGEAAAEDILASCDASKSRIEVWQLDMGDISSIKAFAKRAETLDRLDAAILNAGVMSMQWSMAGDMESHVAINTVNALLLATLLLPTLRSSAKKTRQRGRLTFVGSDLMYVANLAEFETEGSILDKLNDEERSRPWAPRRYQQSKILLFWGVKELAKRHSLGPDSNALITVQTPGACESDLFRDEVSPALKAVVKFSQKAMGMRTTEVGGRTLVHAVSSEVPDEAHGKFLMDCQVASEGMNVTSAQAQRLAKKWNEELFSKLEKEVGAA